MGQYFEEIQFGCTYAYALILFDFVNRSKNWNIFPVFGIVNIANQLIDFGISLMQHPATLH